MMNAIANDGVFLDPSVLLGACTADGSRVIDPAEQTGQRKAISDSVAGRLQGMLRRVVEEGTGRAASEVPGGAAGKTGTAQTGRYAEDGTEIMDLWFAGWYPDEKPNYTILVLQDTATNTLSSCTEIFAQVCQALYWLENS